MKFLNISVQEPDEVYVVFLKDESLWVEECRRADLFALAQQNQYYPLYVSHGHFREVMNPELAAT